MSTTTAENLIKEYGALVGIKALMRYWKCGYPTAKRRIQDPTFPPEKDKGKYPFRAILDWEKEESPKYWESQGIEQVPQGRLSQRLEAII